ncbi:helix-turn-helix protein [Thermincola ferriacetica]|uniref:Helix-turn-helix protein n=1 Tax=Thermincola ferriacetica TaxID=281456 RepID=A0A0L6W426_9FIRM|nr:HigA family addiction module antitoxin [Thermincola ferriacetica]KNZ70221.1 helix-turn-helix protein [Thermincola ferriacetica]
MASNQNFRACIAIPPGETLKEHIEDIGMSQKELAKRMGLTEKHISEIINGKASISQETSLKLENVLGIPASFWNKLEANYQETKARIEAEEKINEEIEIAKEIPYSEIARLNWVEPTRRIRDRVVNLRNFFGVASLNLIPDVMPVAFRKSGIKDASALSLAAWLRCGEILAQKINTKPFDRDKLKNAIIEFRKLSIKPPDEFCPVIQEICASCGVALVFVPHFKKTYANGATKWLTPNKAMIQLSLRGSFADIFWFSFFHELGHILLHSKKQVFVTQEKNAENEQQEKEADKFAANELIPDKEYRNFLAKGKITESSIIFFAEKLNIHSGIVVGRLQHDKILKFNQYTHLRTRYTWK